jgi:hypothetical protein
MLVGHARWDDGALDYVVRMDADWAVSSADVSGLFCGEKAGWRFQRDAEGWLCDGTPVPGLSACAELDLTFTPSTNLVPMRRRDLSAGAWVSETVAWFDPGVGRPVPREQAYRRIAAGQVDYRAPDSNFAATLTVHPSGFVVHYPELWTGEVSDA